MGYRTRQIEIYDKGPTKRYGPDLPDDADGSIGNVRLVQIENWSKWQIDADECTRARPPTDVYAQMSGRRESSTATRPYDVPGAD